MKTLTGMEPNGPDVKLRDAAVKQFNTLKFQIYWDKESKFQRRLFQHWPPLPLPQLFRFYALNRVHTLRCDEAAQRQQQLSRRPEPGLRGRAPAFLLPRCWTAEHRRDACLRSHDIAHTDSVVMRLDLEHRRTGRTILGAGFQSSHKPRNVVYVNRNGNSRPSSQAVELLIGLYRCSLSLLEL